MSIQRKGSRYCVWTLKWGPTGCLISGHETIFPGTPFLLWNLRKFAQHTFLSTLGPPPVSWFQAWSLGTLRWPYMMETQRQEAFRAQHLLIIRCHLKRHHHHVSSFSTCVFNLSLLCGWVSIFIVFNSTGDLGHLFFFFFFCLLLWKLSSMAVWMDAHTYSWAAASVQTLSKVLEKQWWSQTNPDLCANQRRVQWEKQMLS